VSERGPLPTADASRPFLIDTDTASDDAVALLMALRHPEVDVRAITVVAGNVTLDQAVQNALYVRELAGSDVPVHAGAARPRSGPQHLGHDVHGRDGMGDIGLDLRGRRPTGSNAVEVLIDEIRARPGRVTLVTLGPLTNVAAAFERAPDAARLLRSLVLMGGTSDAVGNVTSVAEFNIWADVEAAAVVFESGAPITMVGWDISRKYAVFGPEDAAALRALGPLGVFSVDIQRTLLRFALQETGLGGFDLPDPIAMGIALEPAIAVDVEHVHVAVERRGELTRGQTVIDHRARFGEANVDVVFAASRDRFIELLHDSLRP
jgi:inosine-uridine nucleoside N-ribohydrolase